MVASKYHQMQAQFEAWVAQIPGIQADLIYKDMFGGVMVYTIGKPFAVFIGDYYAVKLAEDQRVELLAEAANDADYDPTTPVSRQYVKLPPSVVNDDRKVTYWIEDSIRFVQTSLLRKKKRKR